ncbi:hypothetical protein SACS_0585 [Parasaccharibacter apium]|uniref:Uncharacterized protein n=1 Tax=Parasaccharibacter apium TaxID=1510841 RepID=A0A7U7G561_9PROT|nr:hypothetical protein SACS_0585 [Parasaccharibacter apium]
MPRHPLTLPFMIARQPRNLSPYPGQAALAHSIGPYPS